MSVWGYAWFGYSKALMESELKTKEINTEKRRERTRGSKKKKKRNRT